MATKMVTAMGSLRWWTDANPTGGFHRKNGFVSFCHDVELNLHLVYFKEKQNGNIFKLELPHTTTWNKPKSLKLYKESLLVGNCRLRSVQLSFGRVVSNDDVIGNDNRIHQIQLSFAIETDANGVVTKDHGKLFLLAMEKSYKGEDW